jgi:phosphotransferase family enzyme
VIDAVRSWLEATAPGWPRAAGGIVLSLYKTSPKAVIVLVDEAGDPALLVKVARTAAAEPSLVAEHRALRRIRVAGGDWMRSNSPAPIAIDRVAGRLVLAESFLEGMPMTLAYYTPGHTKNPGRVERDFAGAADWLSRFQRQTAVGYREFDDQAVKRWVIDPLARYAAEIGWGPDEEDLFGEVVARAEAIRGELIPLTGRHGDFWMGNLMTGAGGVTGVVDWELASLETLAVDDIYKFPTSYASYIDRAYPGRERIPGHPGWSVARDLWQHYGDWANLAGFAYAFFGNGWFPSLVRTWIEQRAAAIRVAPEMHSVFFPVFLAKQATTLVDPVFRNGYRSAIKGLAQQRGETWLWHGGPISARTNVSMRLSTRSVRASHAEHST